MGLGRALSWRPKSLHDADAQPKRIDAFRLAPRRMIEMTRHRDKAGRAEIGLVSLSQSPSGGHATPVRSAQAPAAQNSDPIVAGGDG